MKVYQLVAVGHLRVTGAWHMVHSKEVLRSKKAAEEAIPAFKEIVMTPKSDNDLMVITDNSLRVFTQALEVI